MTTGKTLDEKPLYVGTPHIRFGEEEVTPAATSRRGSLLYITEKNTMRVKRIFLTIVYCMFSLISFGDFLNNDNLEFGFLSSGVGVWARLKDKSLTSVKIPSTVVYENAYGERSEHSVVELIDFRGSKITSIIIPNTVSSIGYELFSGCKSLTSVTIPNSVKSIEAYAFSSCTNLTNLTIPSSVTSIGDSAFYDCSSLTRVTIPDCVTSMGDNVFKGCSGLTSVIIGSRVKTISNSAFYNCSSLKSLTIKDGVRNIGYSAFYSCNGLTSVIVPNSVTNIEGGAFWGCSGLTKMTLPFVGASRTASCNTGDSHFCHIFGRYRRACSGMTGVQYSSSGVHNSSYQYYIPSALREVLITDITEIGDDAFLNCSGLTNVTIPDSVTKIGCYSFSGCSGLTNMSIPNSVTSIGAYAFSHCSGLTGKLRIPNSITNIGYSAFGGCLTGSLTIPNSMTCIPPGAFYGCSGLTSVTIPRSVKSIWRDAFCGCRGLTGVTIPDSVTGIGRNAFVSCTGLTDVIIPPSVIIIGDTPFGGCNLKRIYFEGKPPLKDSLYDGQGSTYFSAQTEFGSTSTVGIFSSVHEFDWRSMIDENGYWRGLKMHLSDRYIISYNVNGGMGIVQNQTCVFGEGGICVDDGGSLHWEGRDFMGWAFAPDGDIVYHVGDTVTDPTDGETLNLYAVWKKPDFIVRYHGNGGLANGRSVVDEGVSFGEHKTMTDMSFARGGNEFLGWQTGDAHYRPGAQPLEYKCYGRGADFNLLQAGLRYLSSEGAVTEEDGVYVLHLYAIWTTSVRYDFHNEEDGTLKPDSLADKIWWCRSDEESSVKHVSGDVVEVPPGTWTVRFGISDGIDWLVSAPPSETLTVSSDISGESLPPMGGTLRREMRFNRDVGMAHSQFGANVRFVCHAESAASLGGTAVSAFDDKQVSISLEYWIGENKYGQALGSFKPWKVYTLPKGTCVVKFSYDNGNASGDGWQAVMPSSTYVFDGSSPNSLRTIDVNFWWRGAGSYDRGAKLVMLDADGGTCGVDRMNYPWAVGDTTRSTFVVNYLPTARKDDYRFVGWKIKGGASVSQGQEVSSSVSEFVAQYEPLTLYLAPTLAY